jgi:hypothetical protein
MTPWHRWENSLKQSFDHATLPAAPVFLAVRLAKDIVIEQTAMIAMDSVATFQRVYLSW